MSETIRKFITYELDERSDTGATYPHEGLIMKYDEPIQCEFCYGFSFTFAETWIQGVRGTSPEHPDTVVVAECLPCFLAYPGTVRIEMDK